MIKLLLCYSAVAVIAMLLCWFWLKREFQSYTALRMFVCFSIGAVWPIAFLMYVVDELDVLKNVR